MTTHCDDDDDDTNANPAANGLSAIWAMGVIVMLTGGGDRIISGGFSSPPKRELVLLTHSERPLSGRPEYPASFTTAMPEPRRPATARPAKSKKRGAEYSR